MKKSPPTAPAPQIEHDQERLKASIARSEEMIDQSRRLLERCGKPAPQQAEGSGH